MDDLVLRVKQIAQYDQKALADDSDAVIIQQGGVGGRYFYTPVSGIVGPLLDAAVAVIDTSITSLQTADTTLQTNIDTLDTQLTAQISVNTKAINDILSDSVYSFNGRKGDVCLNLRDIEDAGGAAICSPDFKGVPTTPLIPNVDSNDTTVANTRFVQRAINHQINDLLNGHPFVYCFNGRTGDVKLLLLDIVRVGGAPIWSPNFQGIPTAPTPLEHDRSERIATTKFVHRLLASELFDYDFELRRFLEEVYAPLDSPAFTGTPTAPEPPLMDDSDRIATTEWVRAFVAHVAAGVLSFNGRTGFVDLELADITGVGGAPINNTHLTGTPTAPTPPFTDDSTRLATTAFVKYLVDNSVTSFNGRHGAVTLTLADILGAGGQPKTVVGSPANATPVVGELWFDAAAGQLKVWNGTAWEQASLGTAQMSPTEPVAPNDGDLWWDPVSGELYVYYVDPTSSQWVIANTGSGTQGLPGPVGPEGPMGPAGPTGPQGEGIHLKGAVDTVADLPATGNTPGDMWVTSDGTGYVWDGTQWIESGVMRGPAGPIGPMGPEGPQGTGLTVKGTVPTQGDLPTTGNDPGDMWIAADTGEGYVWDGTQWVDIGAIQGPQGPPGVPGTPGATGPTGPAGGTVTVAPTAPATPNTGDLWFDSTSDVLMVWDGTTWQIAGGGGAGGASVGIIAPSSPSTGDLWFDTSGNILKIFNGTTWVNSTAAGLTDAPTTAGPWARQGGVWVQIIDDGAY